MESTIGLYTAEVIWHERCLWESWQQVERATASWVAWYNQERLHSSIGDAPRPSTKTGTTIDHERPVDQLPLNTTLQQPHADSVPARPSIAEVEFEIMMWAHWGNTARIRRCLGCKTAKEVEIEYHEYLVRQEAHA